MKVGARIQNHLMGWPNSNELTNLDSAVSSLRLLFQPGLTSNPFKKDYLFKKISTIKVRLMVICAQVKT